LFTFRKAGFSCYNVTSPRRTTALPCLPLDIKDSLEEDVRLFALRLVALGLLHLGFWVWGLLAFWCGRLLEGRIAKGKRIAEGKRTAEGELLKGNC
jgi:hypothetical protein